MKIHLFVQEKPLSINDAFQGRRFKTKEYKAYEERLLYQLPKRERLTGPIKVKYLFFLRNHKLTDCDNLIKPLQDILQKAGYFENDRNIYEFQVLKIPSSEDKIEIEISKVKLI